MKRSSGCLKGILILAGFLAFALGLDILGARIDRSRFPWGHKGSGGSTLAGVWVGTAWLLT